MRNKNAVLFIAHKFDDLTRCNYIHLANSIPDDYDVFMAFNGYEDDSSLPFDDVKIYFFNDITISKLGYKSSGIHLLDGCADFVAQQFLKDYPWYSYIWSIEYDVFYSGNWAKLFDCFDYSEADFLSSHMEKWNIANISWPWWDNFFMHDDIVPVSSRIKSFNPIFRISSRALNFMDSVMKKGNWGHFEVFLPTVLFRNGFILEDFGGTGEFVNNKNINRFYIQGDGVNNGTMRYWPEYTMEEIYAMGTPNKLFHPIKKIIQNY